MNLQLTCVSYNSFEENGHMVCNAVLGYISTFRLLS
jgi:hypothetical protein